MWSGAVDITTKGFIWALFLNDKPTPHLTKPSAPIPLYKYKGFCSFYAVIAQVRLVLWG